VTSDFVGAKGDRYLIEGRVRVVSATAFTVRGSGAEPYRVAYLHGAWACDCPSRVLVCAHVAACQKISDPAPTSLETAFSDGSDDLSAFLTG
jgi:uncharacterized Zn finger protein